MPIFAYRSTTMDGIVRKGSSRPPTKRPLERLKNTGVIPLEVKAPAEAVSGAGSVFRTSRLDLVTFTAELSALLAAGLPLDRSLNILAEISEQQRMKEIIQSLLKSIREGSSFSDALQKHPEVFPGSTSTWSGRRGRRRPGRGPREAQRFLESSKELKDHVVSAMIYPAILS